MRQSACFVYHPESEGEVLILPSFAGGALKLVGRLRANHSHLLEYSFKSGDGTKSLIVKQHGAASDEAVLREYTNLHRVRSLLDFSLAQTVPEPLLVLPSKGILLTSKVRGTPLTAILKKYANCLSGPFHNKLLAGTARQVGTWLQRFQHATRADPLTFSSSAYLSELKLRVSKLQDKGFESGFTQGILRQASQLCAPLDGCQLPAAARHGDFIPQNILIQEDRVSVVDFEGFSERQSVYEDLGMFLGYILVLGASAPYSLQSLAAVRGGFLAGFLAQGAIDHAFLGAYTLKGTVRIIADGPSSPKDWSHFGTTWILTRRLKHLAAGPQ